MLFSGGKNSSAAVEVTLEVVHTDPQSERHLPLRAVFQDEEAIPFETEEYVQRTFARPDVAGEWYCLPVKHRNACSRTYPWWRPSAEEDEAKWTRPLPPSQRHVQRQVCHGTSAPSVLSRAVLDGSPGGQPGGWAWLAAGRAILPCGRAMRR